MLKVKLTRTGSKNNPSYRVIVAEARSKRDGRYIELLGHYDPKTNPATFNLKQDRYQYWIAKGAQPTDTVAQLVKKSK